MASKGQKFNSYSDAMIAFANEGDDVINLHPTFTENGYLVERDYSLEAGTSFFSEGECSGSEKHFYSVKIDDKDREDILEEFRGLAYDNKIKLSFWESFEVATRSNSIYHISVCSCNDWKLFFSTKAANHLVVDESNTDVATYPSLLSSALHYQLPLKIISKGRYLNSNGVKPSTVSQEKK